MTGRCRSCLAWELPDSEMRMPEGWGYCLAMLGNRGEPISDATLAYAETDARDPYRGVLRGAVFTSPDFGCVQFDDGKNHG
jgi:hypothetical protein